jgi:hypothetical protein
MNYSLESYRTIINQALAEGYDFLPFTGVVNAKEKRIFLRHDIDYSLGMGLKLARVNAELGVRGTFFVQLRSQLYNLLSSWSRGIVKEIHQLGQEIALHAAIPEVTPATDSAMGELVRADFDFVKRELPMLSPVFTWHNPTPEILERSRPLAEIGGLVNGYAARFTQEIRYLTDSNLRHSPSEFLSVVSGGQNPVIQLLCHPSVWVIGGSTMMDFFPGAWQQIIREREEEMRLNQYYKELWPDGMPSAVLESFAEQWRCAAERQQG